MYRYRGKKFDQVQTKFIHIAKNITNHLKLKVLYFEMKILFFLFTEQAVKKLMDQPSDLGNLLRFHRKQSGLTQLELANLAGVGKTVIFDIENGKETVRYDTLKKVFSALNIKISFESPIMNLYQQTYEEESQNIH